MKHIMFKVSLFYFEMLILEITGELMSYNMKLITLHLAIVEIEKKLINPKKKKLYYKPYI